MSPSHDTTHGRPRRTRRAALVIAVALAGLAASTTAIATTRGGHSATTLHFVTPDSRVRTHEIDVPPKGPLPGDEFQATGPVLDASGHVRGRVDLAGTSTFGHGTLLGTLTLQGGQIVFAANTADIDATTYAIIGGTREFTGDGGTLTTSRVPHQRVAVTISLTR